MCVALSRRIYVFIYLRGMILLLNNINNIKYAQNIQHRLNMLTYLSYIENETLKYLCSLDSIKFKKINNYILIRNFI
jgi:hypothetical protein